MLSLATSSVFKHLESSTGYELSPRELAGLQTILMMVLRDIDCICKKYGIDYMLVFGSCLGAVRHGGFIPWDEDLDIAMFRGDFERFTEVFESELGSKYDLQVPGKTHGYDLAFPRIRLKGTVLRNRDDFLSDGECGIWVDLFVWEAVPDNLIVRMGHGFISTALGFLYSCRRFSKYEKYYLDLAGNDDRVRKVFRTKALIGKTLSFASPEQFAFGWYAWNSLLGRKTTRTVCIPVAYAHYFHGLRSRAILIPTALVSFGGILVPVPKESEVYLKEVYGEGWNVIPPENERERHFVLELDFGEYGEKH